MSNPRVLFSSCAVAMLLALPAAGEPIALSLSFDEALTLAQRHSPTLMLADAQVVRATGNAFVASGVDDVLVSGTLGVALMRPGVVEDGSQASSLLRLEVARSLPTGGSVAVRFADDGGAAAAAQPMSFATAGLAVVIAHPLLRGFGLEAARGDRLQAFAEVQATRSERQQAAIALARDVAGAYAELAAAADGVAILEASLLLAHRQLDTIAAHIRAGKLPASAAAEVKVALASREDDLMLRSADLRRHGRTLLLLTGFVANVSNTVVRADDDVAALARHAERRFDFGAARQLEPLIETALARDPTIAALRARKRGAAHLVAAADNRLLPQLDVELPAGPAGFGSAVHDSRVTWASSFKAST